MVPIGVRRPRAYLTVEGAQVPLLGWTVHVSRQARSDTFTAKTSLAASGRDLSYWADVGPVDCSFMACNDIDEGYVELLSGVLDRVEVSITGRGVYLQLEGRDKSAKLIDKKYTKKSNNKKSSEIVSEIAQDGGFQVDSDQSDDDAGKTHTEDNAHLVDNDSQFNTLAHLADREGYFFFIKGNTIYFKKPGNDSSFGAYTVQCTPPFAGQPATSNVLDIRLTNNAHLNRKIKQTVRSGHTYRAKNISTTKDGSGSGSGDPIEWIEHFSGLTEDQVEKISTKKLEEKSRHQTAISVELPGDVNIDPRQMLRLIGTGSSFDQDYYIDAIEFSASAHDGFVMSVEAKAKRGGDGGTAGGGGGYAPTSSGAEVAGPPAPIVNPPTPPARPAGL